MKKQLIVTEQALMKRIRRALAKTGESLRHSNRHELGPWFIVGPNGLVDCYGITNLESLGRELKVLGQSEAIEST
jgi:hypothetical protein